VLRGVEHRPEREPYAQGEKPDRQDVSHGANLDHLPLPEVDGCVPATRPADGSAGSPCSSCSGIVHGSDAPAVEEDEELTRGFDARTVVRPVLVVAQR
jgi:hypothetical protein